MKSKGKKNRRPPAWSWGKPVKINPVTADRFALSAHPAELPVNEGEAQTGSRGGGDERMVYS